MAIHNNDENAKVPGRFEVIGSNGDPVVLKALWIKTFVNGYIDIGCDLDDDSAKVYGLVIADGKLIVSYDTVLPIKVVNGEVFDKDSEEGKAVIDNIKFFTYDEIMRYAQTTRMNNLRLRKGDQKSPIEPLYDTEESLIYTGVYHSGLKNRGAAPGELMCVLAFLYSNISESEILESEMVEAVIQLTKNTAIMLQNMIRNKDVDNAYFGGDIEIIYDYALKGNIKALKSISNMWTAASYGPVDIQPIFKMYEALEEQKIEEKKAVDMQENANENVTGTSTVVSKEDKKSFYERNKKSVIIAGVAAVAVVGFGIFKILTSGSDDIVIVD